MFCILSLHISILGSGAYLLPCYLFYDILRDTSNWKRYLLPSFVPGKNSFISDTESSIAWERNHAWSAKIFHIAILQFFTSMQALCGGGNLGIVGRWGCVCEMAGSNSAFVLFINSSILKLSIWWFLYPLSWASCGRTLH